MRPSSGQRRSAVPWTSTIGAVAVIIGCWRPRRTNPLCIQRVDHESRVHLDIETDDIRAEVARLERLGAHVVDRLGVVMQAPTGQRFCVVRVQRPGFPKNANQWN